MHRKDLLWALLCHKDTVKGKKCLEVCLYGIKESWHQQHQDPVSQSGTWSAPLWPSGQVRSSQATLPGAVIICGDVVLPWLSLVANPFHLFIASFVFRTIHLGLLLPAVARIRGGLSWRAKHENDIKVLSSQFFWWFFFLNLNGNKEPLD